ncbi:MAG: hypothetical protein ACRDJP_11545, partial [Actinomycetota bacterium]
MSGCWASDQARMLVPDRGDPITNTGFEQTASVTSTMGGAAPLVNAPPPEARPAAASAINELPTVLMRAPGLVPFLLEPPPILLEQSLIGIIVHLLEGGASPVMDEDVLRAHDPIPRPPDPKREVIVLEHADLEPFIESADPVEERAPNTYAVHREHLDVEGLPHMCTAVAFRERVHVLDVIPVWD